MLNALDLVFRSDKLTLAFSIFENKILFYYKLTEQLHR